ncbi:S8 family peptidase [Parvibium lacunae]|uniref:Peptidase S8 n=1 Tax=Parvibium lacunae TaxID=1888893 RepID=A0A368L446_9BURK|nr:S8 family peptidase [Parvibium lacunae]RCS58337.1 peptidase S8 [Parvibium lacunae]
MTKRLKWQAGLLVMAVGLASMTQLFANPARVARAADLTAQGKVNLASEGPEAAGLIVKLKSVSTQAVASRQVSPAAMNALLSTAGIALNFERDMAAGAMVFGNSKTTLSYSDWVAAASRLAQLPEVEYAVPNLIARPTYTPADAAYATNQWHYFAPTASFSGNTTVGGANLPTAWDISLGSTSVVVAVLDTGIRPHAGLVANTLAGYDFITSTATANDGDGRDNNPADPGDWITAGESAAGTFAGCTVTNSSWHGTHVAGTIAEVANTTGGIGVAPNVKILPVRVLGKCGGTFADIIDGMYWAAGFSVAGVPANSNPAQVLNMSLGGSSTTCDAAMQAAVTAIVNSGRVIAVAAGNDGNTVKTPATCNGVIAVTAHAINGDNASYANYGTTVKISGPGGGNGSNILGPGFRVYSTLDSGTTNPVGDTYGNYQGTSMATPHVAGVAALIKSVLPNASPAQVLSLLQSNARPHPAGTFCAPGGANANNCGSGLLDASASLTQANSLTPPPTASAGGNQVVAPGGTVTLSAAASAGNAGKTISSYQWTQTSGTAVTLSSTTAASPTFTAPGTGTYGFRVTVTDSYGFTAQATTSVRVNSAPSPAATATQTVNVGNTLSFTVSATDVDGDTVTYVDTAKPAGSVFNTTTGAFSWNTTGVTAGSYTLSYYATDGTANSATQTVNITVNPAGTPAPSAGGGSSGGGGGSLSWETLLAMLVLAAMVRFMIRRYRAE